ncbi:TRAP transporter small permease [Halomonas lysinitropha]|uniref:TRAP transporter small permease protein n=1 Tax=Halomonas lysinitropha TaxID=2607506 RepID=A0A5K1I9Y0_9GAMM|nr:TRAP transporter small permease [Halomonas lysinitropha]VVZ97203.1 Sialic acid TRAP transporter permease protein SiaT [Halomonas lysinitropha]
MPDLAHSLLRPLRWSERALDAVIAPVVFTAMAALIAVITLQVVSRVFFTAVGWTEEVARFLLVWITFLGATLAFRRGRHIAVTFVVDALPGRPRRLARIAALLVALGFLAALVAIGWEYMQVQSFQKSASLRISMTWIYLVIPLSAAIMAWCALVDLLELIIEGAASDNDDSGNTQGPPT